ncbi:hypothetical protein VKT23_017169 [Stygiomarasmius scandens]|uniref:Uncharacterized protein n=1 Tax=Marasmiellus scandens TaxID=2682957 RepID=A0ABR1IX58_9AGAR
MIVDEKTAPPPYVPSLQVEFNVDGDNMYAAWLASRTFPKHKPTFSTLPPHLLLEIVYSTFPQEDGKHEGDTKVVRQRENLHWLETSLRLVCRKLYIACMHILRSTYLPTYDSLIRAPYSSDPFPSSEVFPATINHNPYQTQIKSLFPMHRELTTLDKFIAVLAHEDVWLDSTSLYLTRNEAYKDIFDLIQPKTRLEDLIAVEGVRCGVIALGHSTPPTSVPNSVPSTPSTEYTELPAEKIQDNAYAMDPTQLPSNSPPSSPYGGSPSSSTVSFSSKQPQKPSRNPFRLFGSKGKGKAKAVINTISPFPSSPFSPTSPSPREITPIPFSCLSISFSPRKLALVYSPSPTSSSSSLNASQTVTGSSRFSSDRYRDGYGGSTYGSLSLSHGAMRHRKRTLVEVERSREETLEVCARRLVRALKDWIVEGGEL